MDQTLRLSKLMSQRGLCSRREADELIARGLVRVDGRIVRELGIKVSPDAVVEVTDGGRAELDRRVTILINKPKGYVSGQPEDGYRAAVDLVTAANLAPGEPRAYSFNVLRGLAPAGRLDIDSQGLLVLTSDGVVAKTLIGENSAVEKEYLVRVGGRIDDLSPLRDGRLILDGRRLKPARVEWANEDQLRFVLREGMKRQIRRMCEAVGLEVLGLKRVRIGRVMLGHLPEGRWRFLRDDESFD